VLAAALNYRWLNEDNYQDSGNWWVGNVIMMITTWWRRRSSLRSVVTSSVVTSWRTTAATAASAAATSTSTLRSGESIMENQLNTRDVLLVLFGSIVALVSYYFCCCRRHRRRRSEISLALMQARQKVERLEDELRLFEAMEKHHNYNHQGGGGVHLGHGDGHGDGNGNGGGVTSKKIRILMEGAFDLMHYGHVNAFRLGRSLGHQLVVGVNSQHTITMCKGPPVMSELERTTMVRACRFVDEVIEGIPYVMTQPYLENLMKKHRIDYVVHGDDPVIVDGKDVYAHVKKMGRYRSIPRTEGISTTEIVGRMLLCNSKTLARTPSSRFMKTSSILTQFRGSEDMCGPKATDRIVYIDGDWDMFNAKHIRILSEAKELGDFLIVGVHNDDIVAAKSKSHGNFPIMDLHERVLSVMGCKYVGDVLLDAPWNIGRDAISALNVDVVVRGTRYIDGGENEEKERYRVGH